MQTVRFCGKNEEKIGFFSIMEQKIRLTSLYKNGIINHIIP